MDWLPCGSYLHNGVNFKSGWVHPDAIEYRELNTDELENQLGVESGYEGVLEVADLKWVVEGKLDPEGVNAPREKTTSISSIQGMMVKINDDWNIDCGSCE